MPFALRLVHAELPQHLGKTQESLDRLYYLSAIVTKVRIFFLCVLEVGSIMNDHLHYCLAEVL